MTRRGRTPGPRTRSNWGARSYVATTHSRHVATVPWSTKRGVFLGGLTRGFVGLIVEVKLGLVEFSRVLLGFIVGITEV